MRSLRRSIYLRTWPKATAKQETEFRYICLTLQNKRYKYKKIDVHNRNCRSYLYTYLFLIIVNRQYTHVRLINSSYEAQVRKTRTTRA